MREKLIAMTLRRIQVKYEAKRALPGNWLRGMALAALSLAAASLSFGYLTQTVDTQALLADNLTYEALFDTIAPPLTGNFLLLLGVSLLLFLLLSAPLWVGSAAFYRAAVRGERPKITVALSWFASLARVFAAVRLVLWLGVLCLFWGAVCFVLPAAVLTLAVLVDSAALEAVGLLLYLAAWVCFALRVVAYLPARFLLAGAPDGGVLACVRQSVALCRGRRAEYLFFELSFLLWRALVLFSGLFGSLLFEPYYSAASARFVHALLEQE